MTRVVTRAQREAARLVVQINRDLGRRTHPRIIAVAESKGGEKPPAAERRAG